MSRENGLSAPHLAGWLFADLLLVLFLVGLALQPAPPPRDPDHTVTPTPTGPQVLSKQYCEFLIPVPFEGLRAGTAAARRTLLNGLTQVLSNQRPEWVVRDERKPELRRNCLRRLAGEPRGGMVIAYGAHPSDIGAGDAVGERAAQVIVAESPRFRNAAGRSGGGTTTRGSDAVYLIVFFYEQR